MNVLKLIRRLLPQVNAPTFYDRMPDVSTEQVTELTNKEAKKRRYE